MKLATLAFLFASAHMASAAFVTPITLHKSSKVMIHAMDSRRAFLDTCASTYLAQLSLPSKAIAQQSSTESSQKTVTNAVPSKVLVVSAPATYEIKFVNNWLESVHPYNYPNEYFVPDYDVTLHGPIYPLPIFVSHDATYQLWEEGKTATSGIGDASMFGTLPGCILLDEVEKSKQSPALLDVKVGYNYVASAKDTAPGVSPDDPNFTTCMADKVMPEPIKLDSSHPYMSSFTMLSPSPTWFSGFHDVKPVTDNGLYWLESFTIPLYPYTSMYATGTKYLDEFNRSRLNPPGVITKLTVDSIPVKKDAVFLNAAKTEIPPVAYVEFKRV